MNVPNICYLSILYPSTMACSIQFSKFLSHFLKGNNQKRFFSYSFVLTILPCHQYFICDCNVVHSAMPGFPVFLEYLLWLLDLRFRNIGDLLFDDPSGIAIAVSFFTFLLKPYLYVCHQLFELDFRKISQDIKFPCIIFFSLYLKYQGSM